MKKIFNFRNIVFVAIAVYLVFMLVNQQKTLDDNVNRGREIRAELAAAEQDLEDIKAEEAAVDTDEYIERRAREDLGYVYDYETVYIRQ